MSQTNRGNVEPQEFIIPRDRERALAPVYWNAVFNTSNELSQNYGVNLSVDYHIFVDGRTRAILPKREWDQGAISISDKLAHEKDYFENLEKKTDIAKQDILSFFTEIKGVNLSELSFQKLIDLAQQIFRFFIQYEAASVFAWYVAGDLLKHNIGSLLGVSGDELDVLTLPKEQTFTTQMEREVLEEALEHQKKPSYLAENYYWIPFGYDGPTIWDEEYFSKQIEAYQSNLPHTRTKYQEMLKRSSETQQKAKNILAHYDFDQGQRRLIHILRTMATWQDERKMLEFQLFFHYHRVLSELEQRYNVPIMQLKYLFTHELVKLEKNAEEIKDIADHRMKHEFMTVAKHGDIRIATEAELQKVKQLIERQSHTGEIQGNVASRGPKTIYVAKVRVLSSPTEASQVKHGELLVATMTTPEYISAMGRALGFITDEGGVTCHAAIVAREMNKPCIIGTKVATQVLKSGDKVVLNTETGTIKLLSR